MTATLGTTPFSNWQALMPLLKALGCEFDDQTNPETWYLNEQATPEGNLLLAYTLPEQALVAAMEGGTSPGEALEQWIEHTNALLGLFKANRKRAVLVNLSSVTKNPAETIVTLADHWQLGELTATPEPTAAEEEPNIYFSAIASLAVAQHKVLQPLLVQLEACSLPVTEAQAEAKPEQDMDALYSGLTAIWEEMATARTEQQVAQEELDHTRNQLNEVTAEAGKDRTALQARIDDLTERLQNQTTLLDENAREYREAEAKGQEENALLLEQLHLVQEELERQLISSKDLAEKAREEQAETQGRQLQVEQQLADKIRALSDIQDEKGRLTNELEKTCRDLDKTRSELEKANTASTQARADLKKHREALKQVRDELEETKSQYQAQQKQLQGSKQANSELQAELNNYQQENQLILEQLHLVQEELERQLLRYQDQEQQIQRMRAEDDHALAAANKQISHLQNELNRIKSSKAWKAAAPVRALRRPFKRTPPDKRKLRRQARMLAASPWFDAQWYLKTYPDVAEQQRDPAEHYLKFGAEEFRNPSEHFDTQWYVQTNPDVQGSSINPLVHFIEHGEAEGRAPNPNKQHSLPSPQEAN